MTSKLECKRLFGSLWATEIVNGVVVEATMSREPGKARGTTTILADWQFDGGIVRRVGVNSRHVKIVGPEDLGLVEVPAVMVEEPRNSENSETSPPPVATVAIGQSNVTTTAPTTQNSNLLSSTDTESDNEEDGKMPAVENHGDPVAVAATQVRMGPSTNNVQRGTPTVTVNEYNWYDDDSMVKYPINGQVSMREWFV